MKNIVSTILCLFNIVIIQVCNCSNTTRGHEYSHVLDYDGKTCTEDKILFRNSTPSSIVCSSLCTNDESCTGVYYKPEGGSCVGCSVSPLPAEAVLHDDPGTSYIHQCKATDGWRFFEGSKYKIFTEAQTMAASRVSCREFCGDLVHVNSIVEQTFLADFASGRSATLIYIGLTDTEQEGEMRWLDDRTEPVYTNWMDDGPDEDCVAMFVYEYYSWYQISCVHEAAYACEKRNVK